MEQSPNVQKEIYQEQIASSKTSDNTNLHQNDPIHKGETDLFLLGHSVILNSVISNVSNVKTILICHEMVKVSFKTQRKMVRATGSSYYWQRDPGRCLLLLTGVIYIHEVN